jgi:hypothetical protein
MSFAWLPAFQRLCLSSAESSATPEFSSGAIQPEEVILKTLSTSTPQTLGEIKDALKNAGFEMDYAPLQGLMRVLIHQKKVRPDWLIGEPPVRVFFSLNSTR